MQIEAERNNFSEYNKQESLFKEEMNEWNCSEFSTSSSDFKSHHSILNSKNSKLNSGEMGSPLNNITPMKVKKEEGKPDKNINQLKLMISGQIQKYFI